MLSTVRVHRATPRDLAELTRLFEGYRAFYRCPPAPGRARRFLARRLSAADSRLWVARLGSGRAARCVGFVQVYPVQSSLRMRAAWILNDLLVDPDARRHGVARALMRAVSAAARRAGASYVELATQRTNRGAQSLYATEGYRRDTEFEHWELTCDGRR